MNENKIEKCGGMRLGGGGGDETGATILSNIQGKNIYTVQEKKKQKINN